MSTASTIPAKIQLLAALWAQTRESVSRFEAASVDIATRARDCGVGAALSSIDGTSMLVDRARDMNRFIIGLAAAEYAPAGSRVTIDVRDIESKCRAYKASEPDEYDPIAIWEYLESVYGGGRGVEMVYAEIADVIRNRFRELSPWNKDASVKVVAGRPVLTQSLHWDDDFLPVRYGCRCKDDVLIALQALQAAAARSGRWIIDPSDLSKVASVFSLGGTMQVPSEMMSIADGLVTLRFFQRKLEYRLHPDFAEEVRLLLAEYPSRR